jgi:hypothetical protein
MVQAGLKAGLIGGVIAVALALMGLTPCLGELIACFACFGTLLLWIGVGAGAVSLGGKEIQTAGEGAGAGAVAGAVTAAIGGVVNIVIGLARAAIFGTTAAASTLSQIPPETWRTLRDLGIDPSLFVRWTAGFGGALVGGTFCCLTGIVIAVILGALGGLLWKTVKAT